MSAKHPRINYTWNDTPLCSVAGITPHCCCCCWCRRHYHRYCCCCTSPPLSLSRLSSHFPACTDFLAAAHRTYSIHVYRNSVPLTVAIYLCASIHFSITSLFVSLWASKCLMYASNIRTNTFSHTRIEWNTIQAHIGIAVFMHIQKRN